MSCNAYFAQLGTYKVGCRCAACYGGPFWYSCCQSEYGEETRKMLFRKPAYGQGPGGRESLPDGASGRHDRKSTAACRTAVGSRMKAILVSSRRTQSYSRNWPALSHNSCAALLPAARAGRLANRPVQIAGKTGTAELAKGASHAWFIGFAPYDSPGRRIAFAVLVENGQYGGTAAAPIAGEIVAAAAQLGFFNGIRHPEATQ